MRIARALRLLLGSVLGLLSVAVAGWSFFVVGQQYVRAHRATPGVTELTILHWGNPAEEQIVQSLVAEFERTHPDILIHRINAGDAAALDIKLKTMFAADVPPDLFYLGTDSLSQMATDKLLRPIDDYVAREQTPEAKRWIKDFYPVLLDSFRYDGATRGKGPLYGLPKDFTTLVMYVNLDLFARANIPVPYNGWTWDEYERIGKKLAALPSPDDREIYGSVMETWSGVLMNILWTYGGDYFGRDFHDLVLDQPAAQRALEMIRRIRFVDGSQYCAAGTDKTGDIARAEFLTGHAGIQGPLGRWLTPTYRQITAFHWDIVPIPHETQRATNLLTVAWAMAAGSKHPDQAWELMKFLTGPAGQAMTARSGLAIPTLKSVAESNDFLDPTLAPAHTRVFLDEIPYGHISQLPREAEFDRIVQDRMSDSIELSEITPLVAAQQVRTQWLEVLDSPLNRDSFPRMRWDWAAMIAGAVLAVALALLAWGARRERVGALDRRQERAGWMFVAPWVIGFLALTLGPMVVSLLLSTTRWTGMTPLSTADFVGTANYRQLYREMKTIRPAAAPTAGTQATNPSAAEAVTALDPFPKSLLVTGEYVLIAVPLGQLAALAVALLMNSRIRGITGFRTVYYVPSVISGVALATIWLTVMFNRDYGLLSAVLRPTLHAIDMIAHDYRLRLLLLAVVYVATMSLMLFLLRRVEYTNRLIGAVLISAIFVFLMAAFLRPILAFFPTEPPDWFGHDAATYAIPAFVLMSLWGVGAGMIIYLAGLKGIPESLYEAATIDGAGIWRRFFNITLPMLSPLIFYNVVMGLIGSFQIFTQAFVMPSVPGNNTLFYVLNLYRTAFEYHQMGYASAMAWVLFVLVLLLTALVFKSSKNLVFYEGMKA
jgi:ABC-type sugar transport system permease subunit/ABC-type glycerol-3-phosphate transport system substrate-binding protein